jgi:hypothetical protein
MSRASRALFHVSKRNWSTQATFHYLEDLEEYKTTKPYHINIPSWALPTGQQSNEVSIPYYNIHVEGVRDKAEQFTLDRNGFQIEKEDERGINSVYDCLDFEEYADEQRVKGVIRPAVEHFLKRKLPGAQDVIAFSSQALLQLLTLNREH